MTAGRILFTGLLALALAIGASSTASARSSYSIGFSTGAPAWGGYYGYTYPAYYYAPPPPPPPPVVAYPYPYYSAPYYYNAGPSFSFGIFGH